jgi:hypothetical protein
MPRAGVSTRRGWCGTPACAAMPQVRGLAGSQVGRAPGRGAGWTYHAACPQSRCRPSGLLHGVQDRPRARPRERAGLVGWRGSPPYKVPTKPPYKAPLQSPATKPPHQPKRWRTTSWQAPKGRQVPAGTLLLGAGAWGGGRAGPFALHPAPAARRCGAGSAGGWDRAARPSTWQVVIAAGTPSARPPAGDPTAAVDRGAIHPAARTDGKETVIITGRALRATAHYTAQRLAELHVNQARTRQGSRAVGRLQRRQSRLLATSQRRARDRARAWEHTISRAGGSGRRSARSARSSGPHARQRRGPRRRGWPTPHHHEPAAARAVVARTATAVQDRGQPRSSDRFGHGCHPGRRRLPLTDRSRHAARRDRRHAGCPTPGARLWWPGVRSAGASGRRGVRPSAFPARHG